MEFLKKNWLWVVVPAALFLALIAAALLMGGEGARPFDYNH
jgi:hypothetical protein